MTGGRALRALARSALARSALSLSAISLSAISLSAPALPTAAGAQGAAPRAGAGAPAGDWPAPLDRRVSLRVRDVALRTALDRLAAAARVRLSYSAESVPLDRTVSAALDGTPLGDALVTLLGGAAVEPVVVGAEQVVLAPARRAPARPDASPPSAAARVAVLDQVVVTGSAVGASERALPFALSVARVARGGDAGTLARGIDGAVPGIWAWAQSPASLLARYGSVRGASSFGLTAPKVYVDGVEAANPLLVTALAPESVERVEVIRGPQGAAFYGADAISGVINIVTRHDGAADGRRQLDVRGTLGGAGSAFADKPALTQDHGLAYRAGSGARAGGATLSATSIGAYVPGAGTRHLFGSVYGRRVGTRWALSGTGHLDARRANTVASPLVRRALPAGWSERPPAARDLPAQSVSQYTIGGTATRTDGERWTHVLTGGVNGYHLVGLAVDPVAVPSSVDSALLAARGDADRGTLRASSVARLGGSGPTRATVTLAADYAALRDATVGGTTAAATTTWLQTLGVSAQATVAWRETWFATAGLRGERNDGYAAASRHAALPMFGASWVREAGAATVKLRTAYGRGLRPARTAPRITSWRGAGANARVPDLAPEEQAGIEGGIDLFFGGRGAPRAVELHATAFDQRASGLIQQVAVLLPGSDPAPRPGAPGAPAGGGSPARRLAYALQNVGVIDNRGVELEAAWRAGALAVAGTFTHVDSRVRRLAAGYTGDLRPGDRMLEVPARSAGLDASWTARGWSATVGAARAFDWINYDRVALARAYTAPSRQPRDLVGAPLRAFWREYPGVTHLRASFARDVGRGVAITLTGDNLLGNQRGEPDNVTVLPGRTIGLGARARF